MMVILVSIWRKFIGECVSVSGCVRMCKGKEVELKNAEYDKEEKKEPPRIQRTKYVRNRNISFVGLVSSSHTTFSLVVTPHLGRGREEREGRGRRKKGK